MIFSPDYFGLAGSILSFFLLEILTLVETSNLKENSILVREA